jgi:hypothetical protein
MFLLEFQPYGVMAGICDIGESLHHTQGEEYGRVISESGVRIALLDPVQCRSADGSPFCQNRDGYAPPPPGIANIRAQLSQGSEDR